jgi:hypothetical protein
VFFYFTADDYALFLLVAFGFFGVSETKSSGYLHCFLDALRLGGHISSLFFRYKKARPVSNLTDVEMLNRS